MSQIAERLGSVRDRIAAAARRAGRDPDDVELIAVSKTFPVACVLEAVAAGQRRFGENRIQEALAKIPEVSRRTPVPLEWHGIGQIQRNKAGRALDCFDVIHSVDRPELARALDRHAQATGRQPRILIQINIDEEPQKGGVVPAQAARLLAEVTGLSSLELVGLMAIPRARTTPESMRSAFARMRELRDRLQRDAPEGVHLRELSMGMSADFEVAIEEGATLVRVGTAIFGERKPLADASASTNP